MTEIEEARTFAPKTLQETYLCQNPEELADAIIALSGWRFRLGQLLSEVTLEYEKAYADRKNIEGGIFVTLKAEGATNQECLIKAEIAIKEHKEKENQAMYRNMQVKNLWEDLKIAIDSIKYKINSLVKERVEINSNENLAYRGGKR